MPSFQAALPGKPDQMSPIGAAVPLNINSFYSLIHARVVMSDWKSEYNHARPHSSLGYLPPAEYARQCAHQMETDDSHNVRT